MVWEDAPKKLTRRCVFMEVYGDTGTGRTTLALTAPGPIALFHASEKMEGIVQKAARDKEVRMHDFGAVFVGGPNKIASEASDILANMQATWVDAFSWAKTIILDTHTEAWELLRLARFGTLTPRGKVAHLYGPVNAEWRSMMSKRFRSQNRTNLIIIGQTKEYYKNDKPTGRTVRAGQKEVPFMVDVAIRTARDLMESDFTATIEKGWWNALMEGTPAYNEDITFPYLMSLITETDEEEWE